MYLAKVRKTETWRTVFGILNPITVLRTVLQASSQKNGKRFFDFLHDFASQQGSNPRRAEESLLGLAQIALSRVDERAVHSDKTREMVSPALRGMLHRYGAMAKAAYCFSELEGLGKIKMKFEEELIEKPFFYVLEEGKEAVVVIRGTQDMEDVLADIDATSIESVDQGRVHRGIWNSADFVYEKLRSFPLDTYGSITLTGHSLGAGASVYLSRRLQKDYPDKTVRCFAFGCPPVLEKTYALQNDVETYCVIHNADVIPRLSTRSLVDLADRCATGAESSLLGFLMRTVHGVRRWCIAWVRFLEEKPIGKLWLIKAFLSFVGKFEIFLRPVGVEKRKISSDIDKAPTLYAPGVVIFKLGERLEIAKENEREARILVTYTMLSDHAQHHYVVSMNDIGGG